MTMTQETGNRKRILHLEDNALDAELIGSILSSEGMDCQVFVAKSESEFRKAVEKKRFDVILADFSLPSFDGFAALSILRQGDAQTPFIFVSGEIGEEQAIESLKKGATDYILKSNLGRLVPSIRRALREVEEQKAFVEILKTALNQKAEDLGFGTDGGELLYHLADMQMDLQKRNDEFEKVQREYTTTLSKNEIRERQRLLFRKEDAVITVWFKLIDRH